MLHVEPGETVTGPACGCCGRAGRSAFGFVHRGTESIAFYYAWLDPHPDRRVVSVAISLGDWGLGGEGSARSAVALRFEADRGEITGSFLEPEASPFGDRDVLGPFLGVAQAGESPLKPLVLEVAEAIVLDDPEVNAHLMA